MSNGVKQGDILSPKFFTMYIDQLFSILEGYGLGCYMNGVFCGVLGYADDLAITSA